MKKLVKLGLCVFSVICMLTIGVNAEEVTLQSIIDSNSTVNITLDKDYEEDLDITGGKSVTIDLNGNTLTTSLINIENSSLTIKDSTSKGTIKSTKSIQVDNSTFTLESGNIEVSKDYGVYALNGGKAIINGGSITSLYAPLTGNNTTGAMIFEVNGGVLTAKEGPAVYMAGPISLDITDGTLNGGVSLRMGKVNISGGTINATTGSIDSYTDYYSYSGNAWFPDAVYVWNGTYDTDIDGETNVLDLNITGGTFNCNNGEGSAVAIYDMGKVEQESSINISGDAILKTNATNRKAYEVLSLSDIGVTSPKAGYNNTSYTNKIQSEITGGTFSTDESEYTKETYKTIQDENGNYVVVKEEQKQKADITVTKKSSTKKDDEADENPNTVDNIGSYMTMLLGGITSLGLSIRKRLVR